MTDKQLLVILECCASDENIACCKKCALCEKYDCYSEVSQYALDLINRQQAEIEKLQKENYLLSENADTAFQDGLNEAQELYALQVEGEIKSEAIKEFAERLKEEIICDTAYGCDCNQHSGYYDYKIKIGDIPEYIDDIVKKLTEVNQNDE